MRRSIDGGGTWIPITDALGTLSTGSLTMDPNNFAAEGVRWFETYLTEEPGGALTEQALGRIMELTKRDSAAARSGAERSLARCPDGSYAGRARSILAP